MWASKGKGGIIIIDEAECALGSRCKINKESDNPTGALNGDSKSSSCGYSRDCLNVLLSMTGTFGNIMLILTTSNPSELDEAVLDRMDEHIHLTLPTKQERFAILNKTFSCMFCSSELNEKEGWRSLFSRARSRAKYNQCFDVEAALSEMAEDSNTNGFSGRELKKAIRMMLYKCHASDSGILDSSLWNKETRILCETFAAKHRLKS